MKDFGKLIFKLGNSIRQNVNSALDGLEITAAQTRVLEHVICEGTSPKELEERMDLSHATVAGLLARLEKNGFLRLETDPSDRRCRRVYPSEKALAWKARIQKQVSLTEAQLTAGFTEAEQQQFQAFLLRALENMRKEEKQSKEEWKLC